MSAALALSLRSIANHVRDHKDDPELAAVIDDAADRIGALEAEVSRRDLLLDNQAQRVKALEAALREIETAPVRFDDGSLGKIDVPYGRGIIKGLESSAEIARAALAPEQDK